MSENSFALKYRPKKLSEVVGQPLVTQSLTNAFKENTLHHSYIFGGKFGCGKTTTARILAAMLNDPAGMTLEPNLENKVVQSIFRGDCIDVKELDAASNRGVDDIRELEKESRYAPIECRYKVFIIDECLDKNSRVETNIGLIPIGVIVNNKLTPLVKSYNHDLGCIEYKPITGWFKNSAKECFKVSFEGKGKVYCSEGHLFATKDGYKKLKDLKVGDKVLRSGIPMSYVQKQLILGSLLGDMSIQRGVPASKKEGHLKTHRCRIKMTHGEKQSEYIKFKANILSSFCSTKSNEFFHSGFEGYPEKKMFCYYSKTSSALSEVFNLVVDTSLSRPRKKVTIDWLNQINDIGMAFWYCDDGSAGWRETKSKGYLPSISFSTEGFTKSESEIIASWLLQKGYNAKVLTSSKNDLWHVSLDTDSSIRFIKKISKYVHPSMRYKIDKLEGIDDFEESLLFNETPSEGVVEEEILSIKSIGHKDITYDIEVEGNHNYFVSGTLVHNCHSLTNIAIEAMLKLIEEPPPNVLFIFCTTEPNALKDTIRSRSITLKFNKIHWSALTQHLAYVAKQEKLDYEEEALKICAIQSEGSARNALQNLQKLVNYSSGKLTAQVAQDVLGVVDDKLFYTFVESICKINPPQGVKCIEEMISGGRRVDEVVNGFYQHLRNLMLTKTCGKSMTSLGFGEEQIARLSHQSQETGLELVIEMMTLMNEVVGGISLNLDPQALLEKFMIQSVIAKKKLESKKK